MKKQFLLMAILWPFLIHSQNQLTYQLPPKEIIDLVDAPAMPTVSISPNNSHILLLDRPELPSISDLAADELRLGGIRINPATNGRSRSGYSIDMTLTDITGQQMRKVGGLPINPRISNVSWSPDENYIAFSNTTDDGIEIWMVDVLTSEAQKLPLPYLNDAMGSSMSWLSDSKRIIFKAIPADRPDAPEAPKFADGPVIQQSLGQKAAVRTYQDLLSNPYEEALFDYYTTSQLLVSDIYGNAMPLGEPGVMWWFSPSPDGQYVFVNKIQKPYSYIVPYSRFPQQYQIINLEGEIVRTLAEIPLADNIPQGFDAVRQGPRSLSWQSDVPATLFWAEAIDEGDPAMETTYRDQVFYLEAPFTEEPTASFKLERRYAGISWGKDDYALLSEYWRRDRRSVSYSFNPGDLAQEPNVVFDRSTEDRYNDPGRPLMVNNQYGFNVMQFDKEGSNIYLSGQGASPDGNFPFIHAYHIHSGKSNPLWQCETPYYEYVVRLINTEEGLLITQRESTEMNPNYYLRNLSDNTLTQITDFPDPLSALQNLQKEVIHYERKDGIPLNGTLYLPAGFKPGTDAPLPTLLWAYPREFKSSDAAGQVSGSPYTYTRMGASSPIVLATQGYAVLNNASFPIVGEGEDEPNDTFVEQLVANAEAAINKLVEMGVSDRERMAVSGHSYGAFMTANLLAHSDLFATGIARSGAYNRSLTPFGFQGEERTYWQAPDVYNWVSPFMHVDKIQAPILLIHGADDNNSGTFPLQSERYYDALRGHGAIARLVMLPHESHGYRARESVLHMHWEWINWLDKYVKNKAQN